MCLRTFRHVPAVGVSGQLSVQLISQQCCAGMAPSPVAAFPKKLLLLGLAAAGGQIHTVKGVSFFFGFIIASILWLLLDPMWIAGGLRERRR